jgi:hypothetical protein
MGLGYSGSYGWVAVLARGMPTIGSNAGRVELVLDVDKPVGYGRLKSQVRASSDIPFKEGTFLKASH